MSQGKALSLEDKKKVVALKEYFDRTKNDQQEQASSSVQKVANVRLLIRLQQKLARD